MSRSHVVLAWTMAIAFILFLLFNRAPEPSETEQENQAVVHHDEDMDSSHSPPAVTHERTLNDRQQPSGCEDPHAELNERVPCFIEAWYTLAPDDTRKTRRARVRLFATEMFMAKHSFAVSKFSNADKARIKQGLLVQARANQHVIAEPFDHDRPNELMDVSVLAFIWTEDRNGKVVGNPFQVVTNSMWQKSDQQWRILTFDEVGDTG